MTEALPLLGLFSCGVLADGRKALSPRLTDWSLFRGAVG